MSAVLADVKLCSRDETQELHRRLGQTGDPAAREELVERYQGLVRRLAGQYNSGREGFDDLVQVGNIGLLNALDRFDPERGLPFRAFAIPTILGELRRYFRDCGSGILMSPFTSSWKVVSPSSGTAKR